MVNSVPVSLRAVAAEHRGQHSSPSRLGDDSRKATDTGSTPAGFTTLMKRGLVAMVGDSSMVILAWLHLRLGHLGDVLCIFGTG